MNQIWGHKPERSKCVAYLQSNPKDVTEPKFHNQTLKRKASQNVSPNPRALNEPNICIQPEVQKRDVLLNPTRIRLTNQGAETQSMMNYCITYCNITHRRSLCHHAESHPYAPNESRLRNLTHANVPNQWMRHNPLAKNAPSNGI